MPTVLRGLVSRWKVLLAVGVGACAPSEHEAEAPSVIRTAIVGGAPTKITDAPWQISLQRSGEHICGGAILSPEWVVTAQHCVADLEMALRVVAGISYLSESDAGQGREVAEVLRYPGFFDAPVGRDIALLRLADPLDLSTPEAQAISPVSPDLVRSGAENPGVMARVSGWGLKSYEAQAFPDALQGVEVPIVAHEEAAAAYAPTPIADDMLAAGAMGTGGKDACRGDSGGPLVVPHPQGAGFLLAGLVSWGESCGDPDYPGIYARISAFHDWLYEHTGPVARVTFRCQEAPTEPGQSVYLVGSAWALGKWDVARAVKMREGAAASWTAAVSLPAGQKVEWNCIKRDELRPHQRLEWQAGGRNVVHVPQSGTAEVASTF